MIWCRLLATNRPIWWWSDWCDPVDTCIDRAHLDDRSIDDTPMMIAYDETHARAERRFARLTRSTCYDRDIEDKKFNVHMPCFFFYPGTQRQ